VYESRGEPDCLFTCTANTPALELHAYPVEARVLLSQNLTVLLGGTVGERIKCQAIQAVAQQSQLDDNQNTFQCFPPYETTSTDMCFLNPLILNTYTHFCGELTVDCTRVSQTRNYTCESQGYSDCASTFTCNYTQPFLRATNATFELASLTNQYSTCLALRDLATAASDYSCVTSGGTCLDTSNFSIYDCSRADSLAVVCTPSVLPSLLPQTETLSCDAHPVTCRFDVPPSFGTLSDGSPDFSSEASFDVSTLPFQEYTYTCQGVPELNSTLADAAGPAFSTSLAMSCLGISAYGLQFDHSFTASSELDRCLYIKDTLREL
jgi:hypothetical protein